MMMIHASKYVAAAKQASKVKQACSRFSGSAIQKQEANIPPVLVPWSRQECKTLSNANRFESLGIPLYRRSRAQSLSNVVSRQLSSAAGSGKEEELRKEKEELWKKKKELRKEEEELWKEREELWKEREELWKKEEAATNQDDQRFFRGQLEHVGGQLQHVGGQLQHVGDRLLGIAVQITENMKEQAAITPSPDEVLDELIGGARLNMAVPSVENLAPYMGRAEAIETIREAARRNFYHRSCNPGNTAPLTFVNCPGHVRIGKTRTGVQAPQIIKDYVAESPSHFGDVPILDPAYIFISFKNFAGYNASIDKRNEEDHGLGGRLLGAAFSHSRYSLYSSIPEIADMRALNSDRVFARILDQALEGQPSDAVLPIVVHFDSYDGFVEQLKSRNGISEKEARNHLKRIICKLAPIMGCYGSANYLLSPFEKRYFVLPISTGSSLVDVSAGMSGFSQLTTALPVLSTEDSKIIVQSKLTETFSDTDVDSIMNDGCFNIALGDAGGFPGFLEYLWMNAGYGNRNYVQILKESVCSYISDGDKPQGWSLVVQLALARVSVPGQFIVSGTATTIRDLRDRGIIHLVESKGNKQLYLVKMAPVMMWRWDPPMRTGNVLPDTSISSNKPWLWYRLEDCIIDYLQARLAALRTVSTHAGSLEWDEEPGVATISDILPGAVFAEDSELPGTRLELDEIDGRKVVLDENWTIPAGPTRNRETYIIIDRTDRNVHKTAQNNPVVDGYVTMKKAGAEGTFTLFFQIMKHSASLSADDGGTVGGVPEMNSTKSELDKALRDAPGWDVDDNNDHNNGHALVFVSNRRLATTKTCALAKDVGYISKEELEDFMGVFAHRGLLVPTDTEDNSH